MRAIARLAALLLVPVAAVAQQPKPTATPASNAKKTALEQSVSTALHDAWDAFTKQDSARFAPFFPDGSIAIDYMGIHEMQLAHMGEMLKSCTTRSWSTSDLKVKAITADIAAATYKATLDQTCDGKIQPTNYFISDVLQRRNGRWVSLLHQETPVQP
jgi:hypothetical protein